MESLQLTVDDILIIDGEKTKKDAIELVSTIMIQSGLVKEDYTQAMFDREAQISTFLGNGIAIPHGTTEKRESVIQTGLKVVFCRNGIHWDEDNNIAHVIIGIAARANEHLDVLRQLTRAVIAEDTLQRILAVKNREDLLCILQGK